MDSQKAKRLSLVWCVIGALLLGYGMNQGNNVVFVIGIIVVFAGYRLIRGTLKDRLKARELRRPEPEEETENEGPGQEGTEKGATARKERGADEGRSGAGDLGCPPQDRQEAQAVDGPLRGRRPGGSRGVMIDP